MVPHAKISEDVIDSENHRHLAKQVALESIVLLKNDDNFLPITKEVESIAVIGPNADTAQFGNYSGLPSYKVSPLEGIKTKLGSQASVKYAQGAPIYQKTLCLCCPENI